MTVRQAKLWAEAARTDAGHADEWLEAILAAERPDDVWDYAVELVHICESLLGSARQILTALQGQGDAA